jgi:hypothetical protein
MPTVPVALLAIVDRHRLPERRAHVLRQQARKNVGAAPGTEGDDQRDGTARPGCLLRTAGRREPGPEDEGRKRHGKRSSMDHGFVSFSV